MPNLGVIGLTRQVQFPGGRRLAFAEFGDPQGKPVFFFHDVLGTRLYRHPDDALTASLGIRLITIDRPGFGLSHRLPGRTLLDWPDDVAGIADVLNLGSFAVIGHAAGGPYAAACAYKIPQRVTNAVLVAGLPPMGTSAKLAQLGVPLQRFYKLVRSAPYLVQTVLRVAWRLYFDPCDQSRLLRRLLRIFPAQDRALFAQPALRTMLLANVAELQHSGSAGLAEELRILARPWGFRPEDIPIPVDLWWGETDQRLPVSVAQRLAAAIPQSTLKVVPEAGHYLIFSHWQLILANL